MDSRSGGVHGALFQGRLAAPKRAWRAGVNFRDIADIFEVGAERLRMRWAMTAAAVV